MAGLRQAFLLAGARSLNVSMWEVPADQTTAQISDFYDRWLGGQEPANRYQAFHAAQLAALAGARRDRVIGHRFYWAGVVYVGDPGDLPAAPGDSVNKSTSSELNFSVPPKTKLREAKNPNPVRFVPSW